jgi:hypothetical protein
LWASCEDKTGSSEIDGQLDPVRGDKAFAQLDQAGAVMTPHRWFWEAVLRQSFYRIDITLASVCVLIGELT